MLEIRVEALELCFVKKDADHIKQFIGRFSSFTSEAAEDNLAELDAKVEIGSCPPCELFAKLRPVSDMEVQIEKYHSCTAPKHLRDRPTNLAFSFFLVIVYIYIFCVCFHMSKKSVKPEGFLLPKLSIPLLFFFGIYLKGCS